MSYSITFVIRKSKTDGKASNYPLSNYEHVATVGAWYGCQLNYNPAIASIDAGEEMASAINQGEQFKQSKLDGLILQKMNEYGVHPRYQ